MLKRSHIVLAIVLCLFAACRSTSARIKEQELAFLGAEEAWMTDTRDWLRAHPSPSSTADFDVFVSMDSINRVLALTDETSVELQRVPGIVLTLRRARLDSTDTFPRLAIDAEARRKSLAVRLRVAAYLTAQITPQHPDEITFGTKLIDVAPEVRWSVFQFRLAKFVRELLKVPLQDWATTQLTFRVPLVTSKEIKLKSGDLPIEIGTPQGKIFAKVRMPEYTIAPVVTIDRLMFLSDGIHAYLKGQVTAK